MRKSIWIGLLPGLLSCAPDPPTSWDSLSNLERRGSVGELSSDLVVVDLWERLPDGSESAGRLTFVVTQSDDGVEVVFPGNTGNPPAPSFRGNACCARHQPRFSKASLSASAGLRLYDSSGTGVRLPDVRDLRTRVGLPGAIARPLMKPNTRGPLEGARRYSSRLVTPDRARHDLASLRMETSVEERVAPDHLKFSLREGAEERIWIFDETIGAVVNFLVRMDGRMRFSIRNEYQPSRAGHILSGIVAEWYAPDGKVMRRSTTRFLPN